MLLAILGGLLLVTGLAQLAVFIMSVIYVDNTSWFMLPAAVVMIAGTIVQALFTGIWSVALISLLPQLVCLAFFWYGGGALYKTANPLKIAKRIIVDSWRGSFLASRIVEVIVGTWDKAIDHIKALYWAGVSAGARLKGVEYATGYRG
jgi:hypothetical protein